MVYIICLGSKPVQHTFLEVKKRLNKCSDNFEIPSSEFDSKVVEGNMQELSYQSNVTRSGMAVETKSFKKEEEVKQRLDSESIF
jgi:hypothetical protein